MGPEAAQPSVAAAGTLGPDPAARRIAMEPY
jgi:hypothetical protein